MGFDIAEIVVGAAADIAEDNADPDTAGLVPDTAGLGLDIAEDNADPDTAGLGPDTAGLGLDLLVAAADGVAHDHAVLCDANPAVGLMLVSQSLSAGWQKTTGDPCVGLTQPFITLPEQ